MAKIIARPLPWAVTRPEFTAATDSSSLVQDTVAPVMIAPFWSFTVATILSVAPRALRLTEDTERLMVVARGAVTPNGESASSTHAISTASARPLTTRVALGRGCLATTGHSDTISSNATRGN